MFFNMFLLVLREFVLASPVDDYQKYLKLLSDDRIAAPDKPGPFMVLSNQVLLPLPPIPTSTPVPAPCFGQLVVPVYHAINGREDGLERFRCEKRLSTIYRWMDAVHTTLMHHVCCTRPTKAAHSPIKADVPSFPTLLTPGRPILVNNPGHRSTRADFELGGILYAYRRTLGWMAMTFLIACFTFIRFHRHRTSDDTKDPCSDLSFPITSSEKFVSIIDIYCALGFPSVINTDIPFVSSSDLTGPTTNDVEDSTEMDGASMGATNLEHTVSSSSIGTGFVGLYGNRSTSITPSPSNLSVRPSASDILARYPPARQAHTPRTKRWLGEFVTHVPKMERQGNHHGRVYDVWFGNPVMDSAGLSTTVSQDSLYELLGDMVD